jgi:hypothetical protein
MRPRASTNVCFGVEPFAPKCATRSEAHSPPQRLVLQDPPRAGFSLSAALRYITKDGRCSSVSFRRKAFEPSPKLERLFSSREPLTRQNRRFLLDLFGSITKPDLCIASGLGSEILRGARERARAEGWTRSHHRRAVAA